MLRPSCGTRKSSYAVPPTPMNYQDDNGPPLFTFAMLAAYVAVFAAQCVGASGVGQLEGLPWLVGRGEVWRLITSTLLHGSVLHLAFNAIMFVDRKSTR